MRARIPLLVVAGLAGLGSSYALANDGHGGHDSAAGQPTATTSCQRGGVFGTVGPQTFTVTVTKVGRDSTLVPGQIVTVTLGSSGHPVTVMAGGCLSGSSLAAQSAALSAAPPPAPPTTTGTTQTTTTTEHTITGTPPGDGNGAGRHDGPPPPPPDAPGHTSTDATTTNRR